MLRFRTILHLHLAKIGEADDATKVFEPPVHDNHSRAAANVAIFWKPLKNEAILSLLDGEIQSARIFLLCNGAFSG